MTLRADAQRNLDRLLEAAGECFAEQGVDASIDEIARRAGVGHGTVFRRFPTKDALLAAVLAGQMLQLSNTADLAFGEADAGEAFDRFVRNVAEAYARNRSLIEGMKRCQATPIDVFRASTTSQAIEVTILTIAVTIEAPSRFLPQFW